MFTSSKARYSSTNRLEKDCTGAMYTDRSSRIVTFVCSRRIARCLVPSTGCTHLKVGDDLLVRAQDRARLPFMSTERTRGLPIEERGKTDRAAALGSVPAASNGMSPRDGTTDEARSLMHPSSTASKVCELSTVDRRADHPRTGTRLVQTTRGCSAATPTRRNTPATKWEAVQLSESALPQTAEKDPATL